MKVSHMLVYLPILYTRFTLQGDRAITMGLSMPRVQATADCTDFVAVAVSTIILVWHGNRHWTSPNLFITARKLCPLQEIGYQ